MISTPAKPAMRAIQRRGPTFSLSMKTDSTVMNSGPCCRMGVVLFCNSSMPPSKKAATQMLLM
jgi:hypothetical protein